MLHMLFFVGSFFVDFYYIGNQKALPFSRHHFKQRGLALFQIYLSTSLKNYVTLHGLVMDPIAPIEFFPRSLRTGFAALICSRQALPEAPG